MQLVTHAHTHLTHTLTGGSCYNYITVLFCSAKSSGEADLSAFDFFLGSGDKISLSTVDFVPDYLANKEAQQW